MHQEVRFRTAPDGVRLAYAISGSGPPVVKAGHWMTHLEHDWTSPVWRHWLAFLSERATLVRYDERGCGLSDRDASNLSLDAWVADFETIVDAAPSDKVTLVGMSQGGPVAIAFAARHPERVERLVLYGSYARGRNHRDAAPNAQAEAQALVALTRAGWGRPNPAYRRLFTMLFIPDGSDKQIAWFDELQQLSCSADHAARAREVRYDIDVTELARQVAVPTMVMHARHDAVVPFEEGRLLASVIPDARLVPLDSRNHILLEDEPAWLQFCDEFAAFLPARERPPAAVPALTDREREILRHVAEGLDNDAIARALHLSVRTIERHLSNAYVKLGVTGKSARAAAAAYVAREAAPRVGA